MDVFLPGSGGAQVHDLNPTQFPPVGLFWTLPIPASGVHIDLANGTASLRATKVPIFDYGTLPNALFSGVTPAIPGWVSFNVLWKGTSSSVDINSTDPTNGIFAGTFIQSSAQMEWEAEVGDFKLASDALETSVSTFAKFGQERNGSYLTG